MAGSAGSMAGSATHSATERLRGSLEIIAAALLAMATVLTAWAAFQSTKWSGVQANSYSMASASRVESTRASTEAGQLRVIDVSTFTAWVDALAAEQRAGQNNGLANDGTYSPRPGTQSGFLYERFRPEFRPAVDAWLTTRPLRDPTAPNTPFEMPEYQSSALERSNELEQEAEAFAAEARTANQNGDDYVLMTILAAVVLFFAGISSKFARPRIRLALVGLGGVVFVVATVITATFPKYF